MLDGLTNKSVINGAEIKMLLAVLLAWGVLGWGFNTAFVVKRLAPANEAQMSFVLGWPVHVLYMVIIGALVVLTPAFFMYRMNLDDLDVPETDRVYESEQPLLTEDEDVAVTEDD